MDDPFDTIPVPFRAERLGRVRDLVMQIEADHRNARDIIEKLKNKNDCESDIEELEKSITWLKKDIAAFARMNSMSIEGVTCGDILLIKRSLI